MYSHQSRLFHMAVRTSLDKQLYPWGQIASRGVRTGISKETYNNLRFSKGGWG